jgi:hypothetical protein
VPAETIETLVREGYTSTKALVSQLADRASERTAKEAIATAVKVGLILNTGRGTYSLNLE